GQQPANAPRLNEDLRCFIADFSTVGGNDQCAGRIDAYVLRPGVQHLNGVHIRSWRRYKLCFETRAVYTPNHVDSRIKIPVRYAAVILHIGPTCRVFALDEVYSSWRGLERIDDEFRVCAWK